MQNKKYLDKPNTIYLDPNFTLVKFMNKLIIFIPYY